MGFCFADGIVDAIRATLSGFSSPSTKAMNFLVFQRCSFRVQKAGSLSPTAATRRATANTSPTPHDLDATYRRPTPPHPCAAMSVRVCRHHFGQCNLQTGSLSLGRIRSREGQGRSHASRPKTFPPPTGWTFRGSSETGQCDEALESTSVLFWFLLLFFLLPRRSFFRRLNNTSTFQRQQISFLLIYFIEVFCWSILLNKNEKLK